MRRRRVKLGLDGRPISGILTYCDGIVEKMNANPNFPATGNPHNLLLAAAVSELRTADLAAADGGKALKFTLRLKRANVYNVMRPYRDFVNEKANGNEEILNTTGFALADLPGSMTDLEIPSGVETKTLAAPGKVVVFCDKVEGATGYQVRHRPVVSGNPVPATDGSNAVPIPGDAWVTEDPIRPKRQTIVGLQSAMYHEFQMRAIGAGPPSPWSGSVNGLAA